MKRKLRKQLINATDIFFQRWQQKLGINCGDVDPMLGKRFEETIDELVDVMAQILAEQGR